MKLIHLNNFTLKMFRSTSLLFRTIIMRLNYILVSLFSTLLSVNISASTSGNIQSLPEIRQTAKIFLEEMQHSADSNDIEIEIGKIDPRIRLAQCDGLIEAFFPQQSRTMGNTTVGVRCLGTVTWKLYISVNIREFQSVWVAQKDISTNDLITASDVKRERVAISNLREIPIEDKKMILNASPIRSIRAGNIFFEDTICLVCKGEKVDVVAQNEFMTIQVNGIALSNARLGEMTQIKNSKSKRIFDAVVVGKNQLSVALSDAN